MFKQLKSAVFWYYLFKFRARITIIALLLIIAVFANAIYDDFIQYLTLTNKLTYLKWALIGKWLIIIGNIVTSIYLLLTVFKKKEHEDKSNNTLSSSNQEFTEREQNLLNKKTLRSEADILLKKKE